MFKVHRHTADQEAWIQLISLENPRQHGRGGRFAVCARHRQHVPVAQHPSAQPLGSGHVVDLAVQDVFNGFATTRLTRVANDDHVRSRLEMFGIKRLERFDAFAGQLVAHRWVNWAVVSVHFITQLLGKYRETAHQSTADT